MKNDADGIDGAEQRKHWRPHGGAKRDISRPDKVREGTGRERAALPLEYVGSPPNDFVYFMRSYVNVTFAPRLKIIAAPCVQNPGYVAGIGPLEYD